MQFIHFPTSHPHRHGQALVEFVFVLPVLIGFMLAVWAVGTWMYAGTNASSSLRAVMDNQYRYANTADAMPLIAADTGGISTGPLADLGSGVDGVSLIGGGSLFPVVQGFKDVNLLGAAGILNIPPVRVFGTFSLNGALFVGNASPLTNGPAAVPYDASQPAIAATIDPTNFDFANPTELPSSVGIDENCTANLLPFDSQAITMLTSPDPSDPSTCYDPLLDDVNNDTGVAPPDGLLDWDLSDPPDGVAEIDDPCKIIRAELYVAAHLSPAEALGGCGTPNEVLPDTNDVAFRTAGDYGY